MMKLKSLALLIAATWLAAMAFLARAEENSPWYYRIDAGVASPTNSYVQNAEGDALFNTCACGAYPRNADRLEFQASPLLNLGLGRQLARDVRLEAALSYRTGFKMDESTFGGGNPNRESVQGKVRSTSLMLNLYQDFSLSTLPIRPYLGGGGGVSSNTNEDYNTYRDSAGVITRRIAPENTVTDFAWSLSAGVSFRAAGKTWDIAYRYIDLGDTRSGPARVNPDDGLRYPQFGLSGHLRVSELTVGMRF
jgi:opacity protein-like surface antigen